LPICPLCGNACKPTDAVSYIAGVPRHSECIAKASAGQEKSPRKAATESCPICKSEIKAGEETIFLRGAANHRLCWLKVRSLEGFVVVVNKRNWLGQRNQRGCASR
jgi:hypothetical protein